MAHWEGKKINFSYNFFIEMYFFCGGMGIFGSMFARHTWSFVDPSFAVANAFVKAGGQVVCEEHTHLCGSPSQSRIKHFSPPPLLPHQSQTLLFSTSSITETHAGFTACNFFLYHSLLPPQRPD